MMSTVVVGNQWGINEIDPGPAQPSAAQPSEEQEIPGIATTQLLLLLLLP